MPEKKVEVIVTFPIFVEGIRRIPGDKISVTESQAKDIVGINRGTFDLKWKPEAKPADDKKPK